MLCCSRVQAIGWSNEDVVIIHKYGSRICYQCLEYLYFLYCLFYDCIQIPFEKANFQIFRLFRLFRFFSAHLSTQLCTTTTQNSVWHDRWVFIWKNSFYFTFLFSSYSFDLHHNVTAFNCKIKIVLLEIGCFFFFVHYSLFLFAERSSSYWTTNIVLLQKWHLLIIALRMVLRNEKNDFHFGKFFLYNRSNSFFVSICFYLREIEKYP